MAKKYISFLDTGDYQPCKFKLSDAFISTDVTFIQEAIIKALCMEFTEEDAICIFVTEEAKEKHLENLIGQLKLLDLKCKIIHVVIKYSKNQDDIWSLFHTLNASIDNQDSVIFDLTYYRYVPVRFFLILNSHGLTQMTVEGIYYGAYEARTADNVIPIFDMLDIYSVLCWADVVNFFITSASEYNPHPFFSSDTGEISDSILRVFRKMNYFGGLRIFEGDIFSDCLKKLSVYKNSADITPSLLPVFDSIYKRINDFRDKSFLSFIPRVEYYIDDDRPEKAISMLEEGIIKFLLFQKGIDFNNSGLWDLLGNILACTSALKLREWKTES